MATRENQALPNPRDAVAAEIERQTVIAEAKLLVKQLDSYLELIGEWAAEEWESEDAEQ